MQIYYRIKAIYLRQNVSNRHQQLIELFAVLLIVNFNILFFFCHFFVFFYHLVMK